MPLTVSGPRVSERGDDDGRELLYKVKGETNIALVRAAVLAAANTSYDSLPRTKITAINNITADEWEIGVGYGSFGAATTTVSPATLLSWSTLGGSQHITQSPLTRQRVGIAGGNPPIDFHGAIGVDEEGVPAGCDIPVPIFNFAVRKRFLPSEITQTLIRNIFTLTGRSNDNVWSVTVQYPAASITLQLIFQPGEAQLFGADAPEPGSDGNVYISYQFGAAPNLTNFVPAPGFDPITLKRGWDYLWFKYRRTEYINGSISQPAIEPSGAYVEDVSRAGDFSLLLLPP